MNMKNECLKSKLKDVLRLLSLWQRNILIGKLISWLIVFYLKRLAEKISLLKPVQVVFPLTFLQMLLLLSGDLGIILVGSVFVSAIGLIPVAIKKPKYKAHWITKGR